MRFNNKGNLRFTPLLAQPITIAINKTCLEVFSFRIKLLVKLFLKMLIFQWLQGSSLKFINTSVKSSMELRHASLLTLPIIYLTTLTLFMELWNRKEFGLIMALFFFIIVRFITIFLLKWVGKSLKHIFQISSNFSNKTSIKQLIVTIKSLKWELFTIALFLHAKKDDFKPKYFCKNYSSD